MIIYPLLQGFGEPQTIPFTSCRWSALYCVLARFQNRFFYHQERVRIPCYLRFFSLKLTLKMTSSWFWVRKKQIKWNIICYQGSHGPSKLTSLPQFRSHHFEENTGAPMMCLSHFGRVHEKLLQADGMASCEAFLKANLVEKLWIDQMVNPPKKITTYGCFQK